MTFKFSNLTKPTPPKAKLFGKSLAAAASSAALLNTVNGGNMALSIILVAASFIGIFIAEFFGSSEPMEIVDEMQDAAEHAQDKDPAAYIDHVVTEQTISDNPDLKDHDIKVGDTIQVSVKTDVPETHQEIDAFKAAQSAANNAN